MKIQLDEKGYVIGYAMIGSLGEDETEISDEHVDDTFFDNVNAYRYTDGKLILDEDKLELIKKKNTAEEEYSYLLVQISKFLDLKAVYDEDISILGESEIDIAAEREKIKPLYKKKKEIEGLLNA